MIYYIKENLIELYHCLLLCKVQKCNNNHFFLNTLDTYLDL